MNTEVLIYVGENGNNMKTLRKLFRERELDT